MQLGEPDVVVKSPAEASYLQWPGSASFAAHGPGLDPWAFRAGLFLVFVSLRGWRRSCSAPLSSHCRDDTLIYRSPSRTRAWRRGEVGTSRSPREDILPREIAAARREYFVLLPPAAGYGAATPRPLSSRRRPGGHAPPFSSASAWCIQLRSRFADAEVPAILQTACALPGELTARRRTPGCGAGMRTSFL